MNKTSAYNYSSIVEHYEKCLEQHGDTHKGVDWPNIADAKKRYSVMLDVVRDDNEDITLLDFGCGASHLYEFIKENNLAQIDYSGLDISEKFIDLSKDKFPDLKFYCIDILEESNALPVFDYIVMNGVFTEKISMSTDEMFSYLKDVVRLLFDKCRIGLAFNVMSKNVDWEREDLFHLEKGLLVDFLKMEISEDFHIKEDYGLYEYTVYIYK